MTTLPHERIRSRTIPARIVGKARSLSIWNLCAWLSLEDVDWPMFCRLVVVVGSFALAVEGYPGWAVWLLLAAMVVRK